MSLADVEREHVVAAIAEFRELGREAFLAAHPSRLPNKLVVVYEDEQFDLGPVVQAAHKLATGAALSASIRKSAAFAQLAVLSFEFRERDIVIGPIPGVDEGAAFESREALAKAGVHRQLQAGITGTAKVGAESIVLSGGYPDDRDLDSKFTTLDTVARTATGVRLLTSLSKTVGMPRC